MAGLIKGSMKLVGVISKNVNAFTRCEYLHASMFYRYQAV